MLLVDFYNCVYDTVDNTIEEYDESKLEILESLGIVKGTLSICQSETDNSICVKGTEWYNKYANIELSRGRLTGAFKSKGYKDLSKPIKQIEFINCDTNAIRLVLLLYLLFLGDDELDYIKIIGDNSKQQVEEVKEYLVRKWDIIYPCLDAIKDFKGLVIDRKLTNKEVVKEVLSTIILDE